VSNEGMDDVQLVEWFWRNETSSIYVPPLCFLQKFQLVISSENEVAASIVFLLHRNVAFKKPSGTFAWYRAEIFDFRLVIRFKAKILLF
jgi:hypothetical protein